MAITILLCNGEAGEMKDFQRISRHDPWSKIPQMARKTLTQIKLFSLIKPDEHAFLRLSGAPEAWPQLSDEMKRAIIKMIS